MYITTTGKIISKKEKSDNRDVIGICNDELCLSIAFKPCKCGVVREIEGLGVRLIRRNV